MYATKKKKVLLGLNWYRNAHFRQLSKVKNTFTLLAINELRKYRKTFTLAHIEYRIYLKRKGTDGGNVRSVIEKFFLDSLVKSRLIKDDSVDFVISDNSEYFYDKSNPRVEITIYEKQDGKK